MAVTLVKTQDNFVSQKVLIYGIIPLSVLFLFFSLHIAMTLAGTNSSDSSFLYQNPTVSVTTANFTGSIEVTGNEDLTGSVVIPAGSNGAETIFDGKFTRTPSIALAITQGHDIDKYYIENVTTDGFTILIDPIQTTETIFSYQATDNDRNLVTIAGSNTSNFSITVEDQKKEALKIVVNN